MPEDEMDIMDQHDKEERDQVYIEELEEKVERYSLLAKRFEEHLGVLLKDWKRYKKQEATYATQRWFNILSEDFAAAEKSLKELGVGNEPSSE